MQGQLAVIIETIARNEGVNLLTASLEAHLYIYALTFAEVQRRLERGVANFPAQSLQEIIDVFNYTFNAFNSLLNQPLQQMLHNDIFLARQLLVKAFGFANAAAMMLQAVSANTMPYFQMLPIYQQHLLNCSIHVVDINNQIAGWLQLK